MSTHFSTANLPRTLADAFDLLARDFPPGQNFGWAVGLCPCSDPDGPYKAMIDCMGTPRSGSVTVIDLARLEVYTSRAASGDWHVEAHGPTLLEAILKAYGLALEH